MNTPKAVKNTHSFIKYSLIVVDRLYTVLILHRWWSIVKYTGHTVFYFSMGHAWPRENTSSADGTDFRRKNPNKIYILTVNTRESTRMALAGCIRVHWRIFAVQILWSFFSFIA